MNPFRSRGEGEGKHAPLVGPHLDAIEPFHERQRKSLCALHAINNVLQGEGLLEQGDLEAISRQLKANGLEDGMTLRERLSVSELLGCVASCAGRGYYDVNTLTVAVASRGCDLRWHSGPLTPRLLGLHEERFVGLIVNTRGSKLGVPTNHWFAIRPIGGLWYDLDSKLRVPIVFGNDQTDSETAMLARLTDLVARRRGNVFVVARQKGGTPT